VSARSAARLGWVLFGLAVLLVVAALVLNLRRPQYADLEPTTGDVVFGLPLLAFSWFGALIVSRRPSHPIGWLLCIFGLSGGMGLFANEYAIYGLVSHPGAVPEAGVVAWFTYWASAVILALLAALLVLFPSGRPVSPAGSGCSGLPASGTACSSSQ